MGSSYISTAWFPNARRGCGRTGPAKGMVDRGLHQAHEGELSDGPDLAAAFAFADGLPDDE